MKQHSFVYGQMIKRSAKLKSKAGEQTKIPA
jgi:hypothetical protein